MVFQDVQGIFAKLPVELHRPAGADPVGRQESYHIPGSPAGQVGIPDPLELCLADALDLQKAVGFLVQDFEGVVTEGVVDFLGGLRADALDLPG